MSLPKQDSGLFPLSCFLCMKSILGYLPKF